MRNRMLTPFTAIFFAIVILLPPPQPAFADDTHRTQLISALRDQQAATKLRIDFKTEKVTLLKTLLGEGRIYPVTLPVGDDLVFVLATRREAQRAYKITMLQAAINRGQLYSDDELQDMLTELADTATTLEADFQLDIPRLEQEIAGHKQKWRQLESRIADLMQAAESTDAAPQQTDQTASESAAGSTKPHFNPDRCMRFAGVERLYVLGEKANISVGAGAHSVSHGGDYYGHQTSYTITWTAPPHVICSGDKVQIGMQVQGTAVPSADRDYLAAISFSGPQAGETSCAERMEIGISWHGSVSTPDGTSKSNSCTYTMPAISSSTKPKQMFEANMSTSPGFGKVIYLYK